MKGRGSTRFLLLIFWLCAVGDFECQRRYQRSVLEQLGMHFSFLDSGKDKPESDGSIGDPRQMGRWLP